MPYFTSRRLGILTSGIALALVGVSSSAQAQIGPGGGLGPAQPSGDTKKEGVAEEAPKTPGLLPTTPALPPARGRRKQWKLIEIDGYFRLRTDWFKNFHQGFSDDPALGGAPFPRALDCGSNVGGAGCDDALSSTNMRLRLEPTINLNEGTSIHIQADVLDNQVLGGTPVNQAYGGPFDRTDPVPVIGPFRGNQGPPLAGLNSDRDAILIKRAWAEVALPLGIVTAGRMPNHWGLGIFANAGGHDPINGTYDYDADYGDSIDRVSFSTIIPGTNLRGMIASDWVQTGLTSNQTSANFGHEGHPFDLDDGDDANAWVFVLSRMDSPQEFKDKIDRGELAFNYGVYFQYLTQDFDLQLDDFTLGGELDATNGYLARGLKTYTPDVWAKLGIGKVLLEAELVAQFGKVERLDEFDFTDPEGVDIRKYGGVGRLTYHGLEGKLRLGVEAGFASGDQYDNLVPGNTNIELANLVGQPGDQKLTQFMFNRAYNVDMILWRHLIGAVTNAGYVKPFLSYELTSSIGFRVSNVTSFALKPVATPGNSTMYGTEFDGELGYRAGGLFVGVSYGVLFPFAALRHPAADDSGASFGFADENSGDPKTSHTIQSRLVLSF